MNKITIIQSVGRALPPRVVTNDDLSKLMDTNDEWIRTRTGIQERRLVDEGMTTSALGTAAAQEALQKANVNPQDLDLIIAATLSPDYYFPGIGVQIQDNLGCRTIPAIDVRGQCSGFVWALATADAFAKTGAYRRILVVGAEIHSRVLDYSNVGRDVAVLFGDGAGATVLEVVDSDASPRLAPRGIIDNLMGTDGSGATSLYQRRPGHSGENSFVSVEDVLEKRYLPRMEGRLVYKNAVTRMSECAEAILKRNDFNIEDVDLIVCHQANLRINTAVAEKLGAKDSQVFNNIEKLGNTTAATVPLVMWDAERLGRLKRGNLVLTLAFGSGFTWGANLLRW